MLPRRFTQAIARQTLTELVLIIALQAFVTYGWDRWHQTDVNHSDYETLPPDPSDSCAGLLQYSHNTPKLTWRKRDFRDCAAQDSENCLCEASVCQATEVDHEDGSGLLAWVTSHYPTHAGSVVATKIPVAKFLYISGRCLLQYPGTRRTERRIMFARSQLL